MTMWIGMEREGKYVGIKTLFISSPDISKKSISDILANDINIQQIYFGAGGCTKINPDLIKYFYECPIIRNRKIKLVGEIDIHKLDDYSSLILQKFDNLIVTFTHKNIEILNEVETSKVQIKIQTSHPIEKLMVGDLSKFFETDTSDLKNNRYSNDKVIV